MTDAYEYMGGRIKSSTMMFKIGKGTMYVRRQGCDWKVPYVESTWFKQKYIVTSIMEKEGK